MNLELKAGSLSDFFSSAKETAREIDEGEKVTNKNTIWIEPDDLAALLKPERTKIIRYLREKKRVFFSDLIADMSRAPMTLNNDLKILSKYRLVNILKEPKNGFGSHKVIESTFDEGKIEFKAEI